MALLETAAEYILGMITKNEEVKKFPEEFINESVKWVKSWFLTPEDPKIMEKLTNPNKSVEYKKDVVDDKLEELKDNSQFIRELTERIKAFEQQKNRIKNFVDEKAEIETEGKVILGDTGAVANDGYDQKNIMKGKIKAKGDVRIGDEIVSSNQTINHYYGTTNPTAKTSPQYASLKSELQSLIRVEKIEDVLERFIDEAEKHDLDCKNELLLLSARFNRIEKNERKEVISKSEANIDRNRINAALTDLIEKLKI